MADKETGTFKSAEDVLAFFQMELRVPKDQRNDYGNYNYRNVEQINDAFKRAQEKLWDQFHILTSLHVTSDDVKPIPIGDSIVYVRETLLKLHTPFGAVFTKVSVREPDVLKGMNSVQVSGSASSYARKYAAGGLFAIGTERDPDELPPDTTTTYPKEPFDAKCRRCGNVMQGFSEAGAKAFKCPTCGAVDWEPMGPTPPEVVERQRMARAERA